MIVDPHALRGAEPTNHESRAVKLTPMSGTLTSRDVRELRRIVDILEGKSVARKPPGNDEMASLDGGNYSFETARKTLECRRVRHEILPETVHGDVAWEILLTLFTQMREGSLSSSKLSDMVEVPLTTTTRWVLFLESKNLVSSFDHPTDGRKKMLKLTDMGARQVETVLRNYRAIMRQESGFGESASPGEVGSD